ncbi:MAG: protein kinase [Deltaproteobacteria bacterium]|nr:protein kinase [Deltaproteobacteria bacterium]
MQSPLALSKTVRIATEVARGFAAAHAQGVIHRDLKPENVMLAGERVIDLGVARIEGDAGVERVQTGGTIGLSGEPRASGGRVRLRLRVADRAGAVLWSTRVDGELAAPFGLEDRVLAELLPVIRSQGVDRRGPSSPEVRERWERAMQQVFALEVPRVADSVRELGVLHAEEPDDPAITAGLAAGLG